MTTKLEALANRMTAIKQQMARERSKARSNNLMDATQFCAAINLLGLTRFEAGKVLGYTGRQSQKWASGESGVPASVATTLALMLRHKIKPEQLLPIARDVIEGLA